MPAYEIRYLDGKGHLTHHFNANCESDVKAKVVAHAMKSPDDSGLEVWASETLIYQRKESIFSRARRDAVCSKRDAISRHREPPRLGRI